MQDIYRSGTYSCKLELRFAIKQYYFNYTPSLLQQRGACISFSQNGEEVARVPLSGEPDKDGFYIQYFNVYAKNLSDDVIVRLFDAFGRPIPLTTKGGTDYTDGFPYSAMTYARQMQTASENIYMRALAKALEDYGTAAQIYFKNGDYTGLSVSSAVQSVNASALEPYTIRTGGVKPEGITKTRISAMFEADNSLRIYFIYDGSRAPEAYSYSIDGSPAQILRRGDGEYFITLQNVAAQDLEVPHTFVVSDGTDSYTITASVLSYAQIAMAQGGSDVGNLGRALYLYNRAAEAYFVGT